MSYEFTGISWAFLLLAVDRVW